MKDFIITKFGEEDKFIEEATKLGFLELVLCYNPLEAKKLTSKHQEKLLNSTNLKIYFGIIQLDKKIPIKNSLFDMVIGLGTILNSVSGDLTHIYNNEFSEEKDAIHQRRSGLNQVVLAKIKEKNIEILTSFTGLRNLDGKERAIVMGRMKQNKKQCKRYDVNYQIVSFATKPSEMRAQSDVLALNNSI